MGRWPTINFSQYGICSSMVANSLPEDTHSTLALSYIISRLRLSSTPRKLSSIKIEFCWYKKGCCQFLEYVHEVLLNHITSLKRSLGNTMTVLNSLDLDEARYFGGPDLVPNCLQMWLINR